MNPEKSPLCLCSCHHIACKHCTCDKLENQTIDEVEKIIDNFIKINKILCEHFSDFEIVKEEIKNLKNNSHNHRVGRPNGKDKTKVSTPSQSGIDLNSGTRKGCGKPYIPIFKEGAKYPEDYVICGFTRIGDKIMLCEECHYVLVRSLKKEVKHE